MISRITHNNQNFYYAGCITPKHVTSLRGPSPRHSALATQFLSKKCCSDGSTVSDLTGRVVHGSKPGTSFSRNLPFFWNRKGLEAIFHLPEQEFLNLRLTLFMKGFLQLIAQFSSSLFAACPITKCRKWVCICVSVQTSRTNSISKDKNELRLYLIKVKVHIWNILYFQTIKQTSNIFRMRYIPIWNRYFDKALLFYEYNFFS